MGGADERKQRHSHSGAAAAGCPQWAASAERRLGGGRSTRNLPRAFERRPVVPCSWLAECSPGLSLPPSPSSRSLVTVARRVAPACWPSRLTESLGGSRLQARRGGGDREAAPSRPLTRNSAAWTHLPSSSSLTQSPSPLWLTLRISHATRGHGDDRSTRSIKPGLDRALTSTGDMRCGLSLCGAGVLVQTPLLFHPPFLPSFSLPSLLPSLPSFSMSGQLEQYPVYIVDHQGGYVDRHSKSPAAPAKELVSGNNYSRRSSSKQQQRRQHPQPAADTGSRPPRPAALVASQSGHGSHLSLCLPGFGSSLCLPRCCVAAAAAVRACAPVLCSLLSPLSLSLCVSVSPCLSSGS